MLQNKFLALERRRPAAGATLHFQSLQCRWWIESKWTLGCRPPDSKFGAGINLIHHTWGKRGLCACTKGWRSLCRVLLASAVAQGRVAVFSCPIQILSTCYPASQRLAGSGVKVRHMSVDWKTSMWSLSWVKSKPRRGCCAPCVCKCCWWHSHASLPWVLSICWNTWWPISPCQVA